ncbi:MAG: S8/S53 family peptidase [Elusimicrobia bacterium]|nr:S8/S53 family peptidase [Elusimicrobiota bacterium]
MLLSVPKIDASAERVEVGDQNRRVQERMEDEDACGEGERPECRDAPAEPTALVQPRPPLRLPSPPQLPPLSTPTQLNQLYEGRVAPGVVPVDFRPVQTHSEPKPDSTTHPPHPPRAEVPPLPPDPQAAADLRTRLAQWLGDGAPQEILETAGLANRVLLLTEWLRNGGRGDPPPGIGREPEFRDLPAVIGLMERVLGRPLSSDQIETLLRPFPLGWLSGDVAGLWPHASGRVRIGLIGNISPVLGLDGLGVQVPPEHAPSGRMHDLQVAAIIRANAPHAEIHLHPWSQGTPADIAGTIDRAVAAGVRIINMSFGRPGPVDPAIVHALERAEIAGVIVVGSGHYEHRATLDSPASHSSVVIAGGRYGREPGNAYQTVSLGGDGLRDVWLVSGEEVPVDDRTYGNPNFDQVTRPSRPLGASSNAAPRLTGQIALLLDAAERAGWRDPVMRARAVRQALYMTAIRIPASEIDGAHPSQRFFVPDLARAHDVLLRGNFSNVDP